MDSETKQQPLAIPAGLTVGAISGTMYTQNQLSRLSKDYQIYPSGKDIVLAIVPMVLFIIFISFVNWFLYDTIIQGTTLMGTTISVFAVGISLQVIRFALFRAYEKRENMRLMQRY